MSAGRTSSQWLHVPDAFRSDTTPPARRVSALAKALTTNERQLIEQALHDARGQVSGPNAAAATLGVSASTLESKIRRLRIDKNSFRVRRA